MPMKALQALRITLNRRNADIFMLNLFFGLQRLKGEVTKMYSAKSLARVYTVGFLFELKLNA